MTSSMRSFFIHAENALAPFNRWAKVHKIPAIADHICYRAGEASYRRMRDFFITHSEWIHESIIGGRPISIIKLQNPISSALGDVRYLELAQEKPGRNEPEGFEHIEIYPDAYPYAIDALDWLLEHLRVEGIDVQKNQKAHHTTFDLRLSTGFRVRIEEEPLVATIKKEMA